jgi:alanine racemase
MKSLVWVELDSKAPEHNLRELRRCAGNNILICAVVKANAYGHGMAQMVELLTSADWFAVNSLEEGIEIRKLGVKKPILILGHVPLSCLKEAVEADLRLTVYNHETLETLSKLKLKEKQVKVHLKVETGTARQGVLIDDIEEFVSTLIRTKGIYLEGVSTHFANIEDTLNYQYTEEQLAKFKKALSLINSITDMPPIIHTACTAATILFPQTHFSMIRVGIGLYGLWPSRETFISANMAGSEKGKRWVPVLKPVLSWKTKVAQIKTLPEGSFVGYGCTYRTTRKTKIAILPVGYADGYDRSLGNKAYVLIRGRRAPVIGRVCMNITITDITDIPGVKLEDEAVLLGTTGKETISAETMAEWAGTINYEIVARINPLLERRIVNK